LARETLGAVPIRRNLSGIFGPVDVGDQSGSDVLGQNLLKIVGAAVVVEVEMTDPD
jgi:hypothetical protein